MPGRLAYGGGTGEPAAGRRSALALAPVGRTARALGLAIGAGLIAAIVGLGVPAGAVSEAPPPLDIPSPQSVVQVAAGGAGPARPALRLGVFTSEAGAKRGLAEAWSRHGAILSGLAPAVIAHRMPSGRPAFAAVAVGSPGKDITESCRRLAGAGLGCHPLTVPADTVTATVAVPAVPAVPSAAEAPTGTATRPRGATAEALVETPAIQLGYYRSAAAAWRGWKRISTAYAEPLKGLTAAVTDGRRLDDRPGVILIVYGEPRAVLAERCQVIRGNRGDCGLIAVRLPALSGAPTASPPASGPVSGAPAGAAVASPVTPAPAAELPAGAAVQPAPLVPLAAPAQIPTGPVPEPAIAPQEPGGAAGSPAGDTPVAGPAAGPATGPATPPFGSTPASGASDGAAVTSPATPVPAAEPPVGAAVQPAPLAPLAAPVPIPAGPVPQPAIAPQEPGIPAGLPAGDTSGAGPATPSSESPTAGPMAIPAAIAPGVSPSGAPAGDQTPAIPSPGVMPGLPGGSDPGAFQTPLPLPPVPAIPTPQSQSLPPVIPPGIPPSGLGITGDPASGSLPASGLSDLPPVPVPATIPIGVPAGGASPDQPPGPGTPLPVVPTPPSGSSNVPGNAPDGTPDGSAPGAPASTGAAPAASTERPAATARAQEAARNGRDPAVARARAPRNEGSVRTARAGSGDAGGTPADGVGTGTRLATAAGSAAGGTAAVAVGASREAPRSGPLTVVVYGDSFAEGLWGGFYRLLQHDPRFRVMNRARHSTGLTRPHTYDWQQVIAASAARDPVDIAILSLGLNDFQSLQAAAGEEGGGQGYIAYDSERWGQAYARRVQALIAPLTARGTRVFWIGLPVIRQDSMNRHGQRVSDLCREAAEHAGAVFVPVLPLTVDEHGAYTAHLPDANGRPRQVRAGDGIHFTLPGGYDWLANRLWPTIAERAGASTTSAMSPAADSGRG